MIESLKSETGCHGPITNNGYMLFVVEMIVFTGYGHSKSSTDGSGRVSHTKGIVFTFAAFREWRQTILLAHAQHLFATAGEIWVSKIVNGTYVDTPGPRSAKKCQEEVNVERDLRPDKSSKYRLVITTLEKKGCEGVRRFYKLVGGKLVLEEE